MNEAILVVSVQMGNFGTILSKFVSDVIVYRIIIKITASFKSWNEWQVVKVIFCRVLQICDFIAFVVSDTFWV